MAMALDISNYGGSNKICDICCKTCPKDLEMLYGPFMSKNEINVHYFCLLLSTELPQNGIGFSGICGFLLNDIRKEILAARERSCCYCEQNGASIQCKVCKKYFHLKCGLNERAIFQYTNDFTSYCGACYTLNEFQKNASEDWAEHELDCYICTNRLGRTYDPAQYIYCDCCKMGFVHRYCMQKYAMSAGYYLRCIWCKSTDFRESVRLQGIFVPDREARWEKRNSYEDLHRGHQHCDMELCHCPHGRRYKSRSWKLINCTFCGSFGTHYPGCLPLEKENILATEFVCDTCAVLESNCLDQREKNNSENDENLIDTSLYISIQNRNDNELQYLDPKEEEAETNDELTLEKLNGNASQKITAKHCTAPAELVYTETIEILSDSDNEIEISKALNTPEPTKFVGVETLQAKSEIIVNFSSTCNEWVLETPQNMETEPPKKLFIMETETLEKKIISRDEPNISLTSLSLNENNDNCDVISEQSVHVSNSNVPDFQIFEAYEFTMDDRILGSCKLRLDMNSERFQGKDINEIVKTPELLLDTDYIEHNDDIGIYEFINKYCDRKLEDYFDPPKTTLTDASNIDFSSKILCAKHDVTMLDASTSASQSNTNLPNFEIIEVYEFSLDYRILGSCKLRLDRNSARFRGKDIKQILRTQGLLKESDVIERNNDIGIFEIINKAFDENMKKMLESLDQNRSTATDSSSTTATEVSASKHSVNNEYSKPINDLRQTKHESSTQ